eukprot:TRINITY_DN105_c0_g1_i5.p1 TRINITY_DN105_c0_g1~~TRINITY_DN105_c0_g1_i5.p1  ORF type:complete len:1108 (+),score=125.47 TRINITY_DN105_c0_g1_i5:207-3530(+)
MARSQQQAAATAVFLVALVVAIAIGNGGVASGASYPCSSATYRDSYSSLPSSPAFPTSTLDSSKVPSRTITKGHWSETANYAKYRPASFTPLTNPSQTGCPHLQSGLVDWHNPAAWDSGSVPTNGQSFSIKANTKVLVSSCSIDPAAVFGTITVPATSQLILGDASISIAARGFSVAGSFLVGSPTCRLRNKLSITLAGKRSDQGLPAVPSVKGLAVTGNIDIHGVRYYPTWSRLAMTAAAGDQYIFVQDMVNWQPGQSIFITTTEIKDARDWHRNEVRTIVKVYKTGISSTVAAIQIDTPLNYTHYGGSEYQAEVGLLSRNIMVQGDANSEPTDNSPTVCTDSNDGSTYPCPNSYLTGFGGHIQVMGSSASGRFSGLEMYRMGQTNQLGRYPLHFHLIGNTTNDVNYATDCSTHHTFFRCYTIHGTNGAYLAENTAYDAIGNCFYLSEDGVEENNTVRYNLAAHVHPIGSIQDPSNNNQFYGQYLSDYPQTANLLVPADMSAAGFYITNMYSTFEGNAASGGWAGFSFPSLRLPIQEYKSITNFSPANRPFKTPFAGNTAHSSGFWWGSASAFYFGGQLQYTDNTLTTLTYNAGRSPVVHDTCSDSTIIPPGNGCYDVKAQLWLRLEDNKAFLANRGLQAWGNRAELVRLEIHDTALSMNVFGQVWITGMLMDCRSDNVPTWFAGCPTAPAVSQSPPWGNCNIRDFYFFSNLGGFQWYDTGQDHILQDSTFRNCRNDWPHCIFGSAPGVCGHAAVFTSLSHSDQFVPQLMQVTSGVKFENCNNKWQFSTQLTNPEGNTVSGRLQNWLDADGSVSGNGKRSMIGSAWASDWWTMNDDCSTVLERVVCPMQSRDGAASFLMQFNQGWQSQIGSSICLNPNGGSNPCPIVGTASHFGRTNEGAQDDTSVGLKFAVNAQVTGPIIYESSGWFLRYHAGTPASLSLVQVQIDPKYTLILALPYPKGTTFSIAYQAASWCSTSWATCTHPFVNVSSVAEVEAGFGDLYYWDNSAQVLYIRVTMQLATWPMNTANVRWTELPALPQFTRGGESIPIINYGPSISIQATNCGSSTCAPQPGVTIPKQLHAGEVDSDLDSGSGAHRLLGSYAMLL